MQLLTNLTGKGINMIDIKTKVDCTKYPDAPLNDKLVTILQELTHHNEDFSYVANERSYFTNTKTISGVSVFNGNQPVGKVEVTLRCRDGKDEIIFSVTSDSISMGRRGRSNTKETKHLKEAMKVVKEAFKPKSASVLADSIANNVTGKAERIAGWAKDAVRQVVTGASGSIVTFLNAVHNGEAKTDKLPSNLLNSLGSKWQTHLDNYRIALSVSNHCDNGNGVAIRIERDGTMNVVDLKTKGLVACETTYDLPTHYQEKITMLKIVDEDQPIEHIGLRFVADEHCNGVRTTYDYFFLVAGETYTNC
jgi:hypothetical protein